MAQLAILLWSRQLWPFTLLSCHHKLAHINSAQLALQALNSVPTLSLLPSHYAPAPIQVNQSHINLINMTEDFHQMYQHPSNNIPPNR
ncbi:hypothetical protein BT63DRAFT_420092 [Microthyrium microscopicum]|uniref:Uncharacterized protein n=1 Tax=Microthyrium microscopicum TaxID=703497 RepID=A0A6A6UUS4_9PEZI|nr:hypothetical protein BT63DRAFT_420092 [Microthyrium microscopicum]